MGSEGDPFAKQKEEILKVLLSGDIDVIQKLNNYLRNEPADNEISELVASLDKLKAASSPEETMKNKQENAYVDYSKLMKGTHDLLAYMVNNMKVKLQKLPPEVIARLEELLEKLKDYTTKSFPKIDVRIMPEE